LRDRGPSRLDKNRRPAPAGKLPRPPSAQKVLQAFNTWAFKREQPDSASAMLQLISKTISAARPISFVLYWGKGPRSYVAEPETTCLDYLARLERRIREVYFAGARLTLIFTDTHAQLNGHTGQSISNYFNAMQSAADQRGFVCCRLSQVVQAVDRNEANDRTEPTMSAEVLERLRACAAKWFRGEGSVDEGANQYFHMNMIERRAVELAYPSSIFATFNGSEFRCLFPESLPVFFMYSLRRGFSVKPWFMEAPAPPGL
jgi:hypothetical protein